MRQWLGRGVALVLATIGMGLISAPGALAQGRVMHGMAMHGELKYGPDFTHFDYVNPHAPTGGEIRLSARGSFDSFHPFIPKGDPAMGPTFESLLTPSDDEPFSMYGLLAASMEVPDDRSWVIFTLRPEARWHDGKPVTVDDVIWSLETLKSKGRPFFRFYYGSVSGAKKVGERRVKFTFSDKTNRELPLIVGEMPILPKHYWEERDFTKTTLEPPLSSGPYRVKDFEAGRFVVQERVKDYWGRDLPVNVGQNNFDTIRTDYYRDNTVIRIALKAGEIDYYSEFQAKAWAQDYDAPPVRKGWIVKEQIPHKRPSGMQAFVFNTRRQMFEDPRVRRALAYAFDFEWTNKTLFFGQYTRTESYFANSELASSDLPQGEELEVLERYREDLPREVFTEPYHAPKTDDKTPFKQNLRQAFKLLKAAGWEVRDLKLTHTSGQAMQFEILLVTQEFERVVLPFVRNLKRLGIEARVRLVDQSQYINRLRDFDFDVIITTWRSSESPGNEQRNNWNSEAADSPAARNYAGIKNPVIDQLIELVIEAPTRESLVARTRALDRVLLHGHYVIPQWHFPYQRILYWNKFSRPEVLSKSGTSIFYWWYDADKAARLKAAQAADKPLSRSEP